MKLAKVVSQIRLRLFCPVRRGNKRRSSTPTDNLLTILKGLLGTLEKLHRDREDSSGEILRERRDCGFVLIQASQLLHHWHLPTSLVFLGCLR